jgi:hypothetical protein
MLPAIRQGNRAVYPSGNARIAGVGRGIVSMSLRLVIRTRGEARHAVRAREIIGADSAIPEQAC